MAVCREWLTACSTAQQQEDDETGTQVYARTLSTLFPGPIYERRGPGTHCLHVCQISMVTPRKMWGIAVLPWRPSTCASSMEPGNEASTLSDHGYIFKPFLHECTVWCSGGVGFWSTLVDGEVSHKSLLALIFSLLDRKKQVNPWVLSQPYI